MDTAARRKDLCILLMILAPTQWATVEVLDGDRQAHLCERLTIDVPRSIHSGPPT
jgi:hypothetical protein